MEKPADANVDFVHGVFNIIFPIDSTDGARHCENVTVIDDSVYEVDEVFLVRITLTGVRTGALIVNRDTVITIIDDEG